MILKVLVNLCPELLSIGEFFKTVVIVFEPRKDCFVRKWICREGELPARLSAFHQMHVSGKETRPYTLSARLL